MYTFTAHTAKATSAWFKDHDIPVLNWPANSPDHNPIENLWGIVKRKMRYARPNNAEELKATIRATWALITPEQCHRLIDSMPLYKFHFLNGISEINQLFDDILII